ncbi:hypothetical protein ACH4E5_41065 [Streptomyces afghaniensis]|uniref:hypothetical protein n=1 Tax=Streptomyces afghaniensis TaxID=66865 RepID=UPI0037BA23BB
MSRKGIGGYGFDGFELTRCEGDGVQLWVRYGGNGPAVLLLLGRPRTHASSSKGGPASAVVAASSPRLRG